MCNFTNFCRSLAYRHQQRFLFALLSNDHFRDATVVSKFNMMPVHSLTFKSEVLNKFGLSNFDVIAVADKLCSASVEYKKGHVVVNDCDMVSGDMQFGRVINFVSCSDSPKWFVVIEMLHTIEFSAQYHAYCLCDIEPKVYSITTISELVSLLITILCIVTQCSTMESVSI